jgi:hypothetical protein
MGFVSRRPIQAADLVVRGLARSVKDWALGTQHDRLIDYRTTSLDKLGFGLPARSISLELSIVCSPASEMSQMDTGDEFAKPCVDLVHSSTASRGPTMDASTALTRLPSVKRVYQRNHALEVGAPKLSPAGPRNAG